MTEMICRSFKRDFPDAVAQIEALGLRVQARPGKRVQGLPVYWLDGSIQLTGYDHNSDGSPFTKEQASSYIKHVIEKIAAGRYELAHRTREERFRHILDGMKTIKLKFKHFCHYTHPGGDDGCILDMGFYSAWVRLQGEHDEAAQVQKCTELAALWSALERSFAAKSFPPLRLITGATRDAKPGG